MLVYIQWDLVSHKGKNILKFANKSHKKKRINKKWAKRYGFTIYETFKNGETYMIDGKLYMNQHTYTQLKTSIEFENLLKR